VAPSRGVRRLRKCQPFDTRDGEELQAGVDPPELTFTERIEAVLGMLPELPPYVLTYQGLPRFGLDLNASGEIDSVSMQVSVGTEDHVTDVDADAERSGPGGTRRPAHEPLLQSQCGLDGGLRATEFGEGRIPDELDHAPTVSLRVFPNHALEHVDQAQCSPLVLGREPAVVYNVGEPDCSQTSGSRGGPGHDLQRRSAVEISRVASVRGCAAPMEMIVSLRCVWHWRTARLFSIPHGRPKNVDGLTGVHLVAGLGVTGACIHDHMKP
jgi:hypothetical protein